MCNKRQFMYFANSFYPVCIVASKVPKIRSCRVRRLNVVRCADFLSADSVLSRDQKDRCMKHYALAWIMMHGCTHDAMLARRRHWEGRRGASWLQRGGCVRSTSLMSFSLEEHFRRLLVVFNHSRWYRVDYVLLKSASKNILELKSLNTDLCTYHGVVRLQKTFFHRL